MNDKLASRALEWTNFILGGSLFCSATLFAELSAAAWNAVLVGALIVACSSVALTRYRPWAEWSNLGLATWTLAAPFLLGFGAVQLPMSIHMVIGLFVFAIAVMQIVGGTAAAGPARE